VSLSRKQRAARRRRLIAIGGAIGCGVLLLIAGAILLIGSGGGGGSNAAAARPNVTTSAAATALQPTAHPRSKIGALQEGSVSLPANAPSPPASELRANGGQRFANPVASFARIDDWFGTPREYGTVHSGIDFGLEGMGSVPIHAMCDGSVTEATTDTTYGPHVTVDCGDDWTAITAYMGSVSVATGANVTRETQIGMTDAEDLFLHAEIRWQGEPVDPEGYLTVPPRPRPTPTPEPPTPVPGQPTRPAPTATRRPATNGGGAAPTSTDEPTATTAPSSPGSTQPPLATATRTSTPTATPRPPTATPTPTNTPTPTPTPRPRLPGSGQTPIITSQ
jgi:murein DD-endopeptidase MepM/ murein hydrolase activator NlpD